MVLLGACSGAATLPIGGNANATSPDAPVASAADPAGRMHGYQRARDYRDVVKIDGRDVVQQVEYGFDYARGTTVRRITRDDGTPPSEEVLPTTTLRANPAETDRLLELVRTHPQLGPKMQAADLFVHGGGFVVRTPGDPYCDIGSRCIRVIVSSGDGSINILHAVVDLMSDRVVYPFYEHSSSNHHAAEGKSP